MSIRPSRRQVLKGAALAVGGVAVGGIATTPVDAASAESTRVAQFGVVTSGQDSQGNVEVSLDAVAGATITRRARTSLLHRQLHPGDAVAVTEDSAGTALVSPVFAGLTGPLEHLSADEITVQGRTSQIDGLSVVRDGVADQNFGQWVKKHDLAEGREVGLLCVDNKKSGKLTLQILYLL